MPNPFFTRGLTRTGLRVLLGALILAGGVTFVRAQTTNPAPEAPAPAAAMDAAATLAPETASSPVEPSPPAIAPATAPVPETLSTPSSSLTPANIEANPAPTPPSPEASESPVNIPGWLILAALMTLGSTAGFLLQACGLSRAKNSGHTATLILMGIGFGMMGYWAGGFAVQSGGIGDIHAALVQPVLPLEKSTLNHELGFLAFGHHWGMMGSSGFFLFTEKAARNDSAALFLVQGALALIAVLAMLGAGLERGRLVALAVMAFLAGAILYPLIANWVWGGGWLAELGREFGLGHGLVDIAGSGVIHETAGALALAVTLVLGPRHGRFRPDGRTISFPAHNLPFLVLGTLLLMVSWTAANAFAYTSPIAAPASELAGSLTGLAAVNSILGASGGLFTSFVLALWHHRRPEPVVLCRGLLGGLIAVAASNALVNTWAAFVIGMLAGWLVYAGSRWLEARRIDDPTGAIAIHGIGGAWGLLAAGLFANGTAGNGLNGVEGPVRGALLSGAWLQLAAQAIGAVTLFVAVFALGAIALVLLQKLVGLRASLPDEIHGLDWPQIGASGYASPGSSAPPSPTQE